MEANKEILLTQEGFDKLEAELEELKIVGRKDVAEKLKVAISYGDLSENAEYDEAKKEQAELEEKILKIENMIRKATIIDEESIDLSKVTAGSIVKLYDYDFEEEVTYTIVGSTEADPFAGKISNESPIGKSILGKSEGDEVEVQVPDGVVKYKILSISR